jgi:hypothetical protein
VHAYVRACVRDTALFFLASRPNPRRCADSPLTQPFGATNQRAIVAGHQQVQWAGVCDEHIDRQTYTTFALIYMIVINRFILCCFKYPI